MNINQIKRRILERFPEFQVRNERKPYGFSFNDSSGNRIMRIIQNNPGSNIRFKGAVSGKEKTIHDYASIDVIFALIKQELDVSNQSRKRSP